MRSQLAAFASLAVLLLAGCGSDFPPEEIVEKPRPLAGWISVAGDPTRATPAPGETATYEFLVTNPGPRVAWSWFLLVCPLQTTQYGVAVCDLEAWNPATFPTSIVDPPATTGPFPNPTITFTVPDAETLGPDRDQLLIQGYLCPGGALDPALYAAVASGNLSALLSIQNPCADKAANGLLIATPFPLERTPEDENHTPTIVGVQMNGLDLASTAPEDAPETGCVGTGLLEVAAGTPYLPIAITLNPGSREAYEKPSPIAGDPPTPATDDPQVTGYATGGDFDIRIDNQREDDQVLELTWQTPPPTTIPSDGVLVRFQFIVQDDRFAASWAERSVCVVPSN